MTARKDEQTLTINKGYNMGKVKTKNEDAQPDEVTSSIEKIGDDSIQMTSETLTGDLRDKLLGWFKATPKSWGMMTEEEKRETASLIEHYARTVVCETVKIISADGRCVIAGNLKKISIQDDLKAEIVFNKRDPLRHTLSDSTGQIVLVVVADPSNYDGEREPVHIEPDQTSFHVN